MRHDLTTLSDFLLHLETLGPAGQRHALEMAGRIEARGYGMAVTAFGVTAHGATIAAAVTAWRGAAAKRADRLARIEAATRALCTSGVADAAQVEAARTLLRLSLTATHRAMARQVLASHGAARAA